MGYFLVLSRSCADLRDEIAGVFGDRADIEVVVDRRQDGRGMPGIPPAPAPGCRRSGWRAKLRSVDAELPGQAA
jgi:hypothetical protein